MTFLASTPRITRKSGCGGRSRRRHSLPHAAPRSRYANARLRSYVVKGGLGRDYYAWQQTSFQGSPGNSGVRSLTTYRTCAQVDCPAGAAFRQQVEVTAGPRKWTRSLPRQVVHS